MNPRRPGLGVFEQRPVGVVPARRDLLILLVEELGLVENVRELVDDRVERFFELVLIRSVEIIDVQEQNLASSLGLSQLVGTVLVFGAADQHDLLRGDLFEEVLAVARSLDIRFEPYVAQGGHHRLYGVELDGNQLYLRQAAVSLRSIPAVYDVDVVGQRVVLVQPFVQFVLGVLLPAQSGDVEIVGYLLFFAATAQKQRRSEQGCKEYVVVSFHIFHDWIVLFTTVAECCSSGWLRRRRESRSAGFAGCDGRRRASACSSDRSCRGA